MKVNVHKDAYPHIKILITKIIYLMRIFSIVDDPIIYYSNFNRFNKETKFVTFLACLLARKELIIIDKESLLHLTIMNRKIGMVIGSYDIDNLLWKDTTFYDIPLIITINPMKLFSSDKHFDFIIYHNYSYLIKDQLHALLYSNFRDERESFYINWTKSEEEKYNCLTLYNGPEAITYTNKNILEMLEGPESEFSDYTISYANTTYLDFEESFIYDLWFFLKGYLSSIGHYNVIHNIMMKSPWVKTIEFHNDKSIMNIYHEDWKWQLLSKWNMFLNKWTLTNWILRFRYDKIFRRNRLNKKDEIVIINFENNLFLSKCFNKAKTKISYIYGTPSDGYTLAINSHDDKETSVLAMNYRMMGGDINLYKDTINRLYISGKKVADSSKIVYPIEAKSKEDKCHKVGDYIEINNDIIYVNAKENDIYYDLESPYNPFTIAHVGIVRRALSEIPYITKIAVFKKGDTFVAIVDIDTDFVKWAFKGENANIGKVQAHLNSILFEINAKKRTRGNHVSKIIIKPKFFRILEETNHMISIDKYYRLLSQ